MQSHGDDATIRDAVRQERSWELAFESKRLFDLKRWGLYTQVIGADVVIRDHETVCGNKRTRTAAVEADG